MIDGGLTRGPNSYTGPVMNALQYDPKDMPISNFKAIAGKVVEVREEVKKDLSTDQSYLLKACLAVQHGYVEDEGINFLQNISPGNLSNATWLTTANRICDYTCYKRFVLKHSIKDSL